MDTVAILKAKVSEWVKIRNPKKILGYVLLSKIKVKEHMEHIHEVLDRSIKEFEQLKSNISLSSVSEIGDILSKCSNICDRISSEILTGQDAKPSEVSDSSLDIYKGLKSILPRHDIIIMNDVGRDPQYNSNYDEILIVAEDIECDDLSNELDSIDCDHCII